METHRKNRNAPHQNEKMQAGGKAALKKPYAAPVLVEYGTIAKLTQGNKTRSNDGANTLKLKACL